MPDTFDHVNVKIFARDADSIDLGAAIPVFHSWIQDSVLDELLIDVADYRHVPAGPGVMLIGDQANYSLDLTSGRLGLLYNRKRRAEGTIEDKILAAFGAALSACNRLESESAWHGKLKFDAGQSEVMINDRLLAPNNDQTWRNLQPGFKAVFDGLFGTGNYAFDRVGGPRERFKVAVRANRTVEVNALLEALTPA